MCLCSPAQHIADTTQGPLLAAVLSPRARRQSSGVPAGTAMTSSRRKLLAASPQQVFISQQLLPSSGYVQKIPWGSIPDSPSSAFVKAATLVGCRKMPSICQVSACATQHITETQPFGKSMPIKSRGGLTVSKFLDLMSQLT